MILLIELEERRITSVSLRCTEAYCSVTNDHVLKILNFSCLSEKIVSTVVYFGGCDLKTKVFFLYKALKGTFHISPEVF